MHFVQAYHPQLSLLILDTSHSLPLLPLMLVRLGVVKKAMQTLVKAAEAVNIKHTVITCDLAAYEIGYTLRQKYSNMF